MIFLTDVRKKYLLLLPILFLLINSLFFKHATREISDTMLNEKFIEAVHAVEMLAAAVEANPYLDWQYHERIILDSTEYLDNISQVYAGVYRCMDGELVLLTSRFSDNGVPDLLNSLVFLETTANQDSGKIIVEYTHDNQSQRKLHFYFRWMPLYSPSGERYLVVAGVSEYSIVSQIPVWVSAGQWFSTIITFIINTWLIVLLVYLGHIYEQRTGDKWRRRW